ncbi:hypothetical protein MP638_006699 [Amoeboaphelidium occidentale]|nr:hypothetical protein MP638_006699 [Amoeboaphelidium occidentale]
MLLLLLFAIFFGVVLSNKELIKRESFVNVYPTYAYKHGNNWRFQPIVSVHDTQDRSKFLEMIKWTAKKVWARSPLEKSIAEERWQSFSLKPVAGQTIHLSLVDPASQVNAYTFNGIKTSNGIDHFGKEGFTTDTLEITPLDTYRVPTVVKKFNLVVQNCAFNCRAAEYRDDRTVAESIPPYAPVFLVPEEGVSIISDLDDTVKQSKVLSKRILLDHTISESFIPVQAMAALYAKWKQDLDKKGYAAAFHYLSGSFWYLGRDLVNFLNSQGFPEGSLNLQYIDANEFRTLVKMSRSTYKHKIATIEHLIKVFPRRKFILVGDSGEKDPEIYGEMAAKYPEHILAIFIRKVVGVDLVKEVLLNAQERFDKAFRNVDRALVHIITFTDPSEAMDVFSSNRP